MSGFADHEAFLKRSQAALESLFPGILVVDGVEYICAGSGARLESGREAGGYVLSGARKVRVSKDDLAVAPALGQAVELDGEELRVESVSQREWDVAWTLELVPRRSS